MSVQTYALSVRQRVFMACWAILLTVTVAAIVFMNNHGAGLEAALVLGPLALGLDLFLLNWASSRTRVDEDGITTWTLLGRRSFAWDEIKSVRAESGKAFRGGRVHFVEVRTVTGRRFRLNAPLKQPGMSDPHFGRTSRAIVTAWEEVQGRRQ